MAKSCSKSDTEVEGNIALKSLFAIWSILICLVVSAQDRALQKQNFRTQSLNPDWIIVKYRSEQNIPKSGRKLIAHSKNHLSSVLNGIVKIPLNKGDDPIEVCNRYLTDPNVIYAEPILREQPLEIPSDPLITDQYYLDNISAYAAWDITKGDDDIAVAIIDTGVDLDHEDLVANLWKNENDPIDGIDNDENGYIDDYWGYDFADDDPTPEADQDSHGARVGGISGATTDNEIGIAGIGYHTKIAALKGFRSSDGLSEGLFDAIIYAADNGIEVLNLSWGSIRQPLQSEQDIIDYAVLEKDVVIVAAAGNDGNKATREEKFYPASYNHVLSVAGSTIDDTKWSGSSYNHKVDLVAPASGVLSTSTGNSYNSSAGFGTSFAAPMVAATAALVKSEYPDLTALQIMERIRVTTDDIYGVGSNGDFDGKLGSGRLNVLNAVNSGNLKSVRAEQIVVQKQNNDPIFYGDTVTISYNLTNYLETVSPVSTYISSSENEFTTNETMILSNAIGSLQTQLQSFEIILSENLSPSTNVEVRLDFQEGTYSDFQYVEFETAPDYAKFGNDLITITIAGNGSLGPVDFNAGERSGLVYNSNTVLNHTGILLATDSTSVSDNIIANFDTYERDQDFTTVEFYKIQHHAFAENYSHSTFEDPAHHLLIEQANITSHTDGFLINRYRVVNTGTDTLQNLTFGVFADWDLSDFTKNLASYDSANNYLYAFDGDSSIYAGTQLIGVGTQNHSALDLNAFSGNTQDIASSFNDSIKYHFLVNETMNVAGTEGFGNDVGSIQGITIGSISPGDFTYITLIYALAESHEELTTVFQSANTYLENFTLSPLQAEQIISCDGVDMRIDPKSGDEFIFYSDPLGFNSLDTTMIFEPPNIESDTSFYIRNIDMGYPSEIHEIKIVFFQDFADFEILEDTLYLDHPTTNIAQFEDKSLNAVSWMWDFGQGTQSTLQNPSILFEEIGTYTIRLTVENEFGCIDSKEALFTVVERPADLIFEPISLCPNEQNTLSNPTATSLYLYLTEDQLSPTTKGSSLQIGPFEQDTTVYISGRVNGLITNKSPLFIDIEEVEATLTILPDTTGTDHLMRCIATAEPNVSISWQIDGESAGTDGEITFDATSGVHHVMLEVTNENGCMITLDREIEISTSPPPEVADLTGCDGLDVILIPINGTYFGFYDDAELTSLISKGKQLTVSKNRKVYVVSLDDGLPGASVESNITFEHFDPKIVAEVSTSSGQNKVSLSAISEIDVQHYQWYINGHASEIVPTPILFLENEPNEVVLEAISQNGCTEFDTLYVDFTPPDIILSASMESNMLIYPNPTPNKVFLNSAEPVKQVQLLTLSGQSLLTFDFLPSQVDLSSQASGIYILLLEYSNRTEEIRIIKD